MKNNTIYKTAEELNITWPEWHALIKVRDLLARNEIDVDMHITEMCRSSSACIGTWVNYFITESEIGLSESARSSFPLYELYFPGCYEAYRANNQQAANAISNVLILGEACWNEVVKQNVKELELV